MAKHAQPDTTTDRSVGPAARSNQPEPGAPRPLRAATEAGFTAGRAADLLARADIILGGDRPWDIRVLDWRVRRRALLGGVTGLADAYVDGWWDCDAIDQLFDRALRADLPVALRYAPHNVLTYLRHKLLNIQSRSRAPRNAQSHYDLDPGLFEAMLDPRMTYSGAYWANATTLAEAQEAKLDLVCRKLALEPGTRVLDIGSGWGSFVGFAAERYGVECCGVTVSPAQAKVSRQRCEGLPVTIELMDYRRLAGRFGRVVSIGMFEHVGQKNYRAFMRTLDRVLADDGLALLHFFASPRSFPNLRDSEVDWFERNIFPGMVIPSMSQIGAAIDGLFVIEDVHNIGAHYDPTLMAWHANFEIAWPRLLESGRYDERFRRLWTYYLRGAAGAFRARKYQVWQIVLSKRGVPGGYTPVR